VKQEVEIEPLTKATTDGKVYTRRTEVEQQLRELLPLARDILTERLKETDYEKPGYVKSECVAYLIRHSRRLGDDEALSDLAETITKRINHTIDRHISFVSPNRKQECHDEIITKIILPLVDLQTNSSDYAQINFGRWVKYHILDVVERYFSVSDKESRTDSLTSTEDDAEEEVPAESEEFRVSGLRPEEYSVFITDALNELSENERKTYLMRYRWEWEIENKNPAIPTISRHFGVTPRTINNWLNSAERKLSEWRNQRGS